MPWRPAGQQRDPRHRWLDGDRPVFLDSWRRDDLSALYVRSANGRPTVLSTRDFEVPRQPVDFSAFLPAARRGAFEQISTSRLDPRFAAAGATGYATASPTAEIAEFDELHHVDVVPAAGTLVLFDSVSLPHLVRRVTGARTRIAATGWFHEDNQMQLKGWA